MPRTNKKKKAGKEGPQSLADKAAVSTRGYALERPEDDNNNTRSNNSNNGNGRDAYGRKRKRNQNRNTNSNSNVNNNGKNVQETPAPIHRTFRNITNEEEPLTMMMQQQRGNGTNGNDTRMNIIATPAYIRRNNEDNEENGEVDTNANATATTNMNTNNKTPRNPYNNTSRYQPPKSAQHHSRQSYHSHSQSSTHVITSISENLARETCLTTMDAGSPVSIQLYKMANGQTYAETIEFLKTLQPHEILLNEGRKNSQLCLKIASTFGTAAGTEIDSGTDNTTTQTPNGADLTGACETKTVIKFVPRSYFDPNRGAELLRRITRGGPQTYDSLFADEYIYLSSSYALCQYMQVCLGADFASGSLDVCANGHSSCDGGNGSGRDDTGGSGINNRMAMDRNTIAHLELLANAKTHKRKHSLLGTIDCTKTSVGSRLLKMNIVAPPTRKDTIDARLDLVDTFLEDEMFFFEVLELLRLLPDLQRMLAPMVLVPKRRSGFGVGVGVGGIGGVNGGVGVGIIGGGDKRQVTARMASKGISALVCIKSALSIVPNLARVLKIQLKTLVKRDQKKNRNDVAGGSNADDADDDGNGDNSDDDRSNGSGKGSDCENESNANASSVSANGTGEKSQSTSTDTDTNTQNSLLLGLGSGPVHSAGSGASGQNRHQLLRAILKTMENTELKEILDAVMNIFTESTSYSKNSHAMRHQECFALKPNTDGMMDVLRKAFLANVDDIYKLADEYSEECGFTITVKETSARGYYLSIPLKSLSSDLPPNFIQPVKTGKFINCTTEEVLSLSARAQENVQDLLVMTHERIQEVIDIARQKYDALALLSDAIALMDMCHSFADNVASSRLPWCRPVVTDCCTEETDETTAIGSGSIAIRNGRYAIDVSNTGLMDNEQSQGRFIPNDSYASAFQNFTVITGINGSGKSTYLKQLAISVILAHCGSYVPAEEAFIPIRDRICTRIGNTDDQEHNISTFMQEMKDTAFICRNVTDKSLILIDELGRATSNEDGVSIAWAVGEFLLVKRSMTFFVTHYPQLCRLAEVYPNVQNQHLGAVAEEGSGEVRYLHKILPGSCKMSADYGVEMAATCGWQSEVVEMARTIRKEVEKKLPDDVLCQSQGASSSVNMALVRQNAETLLNDLAKHLVALKASEGRLNDEARRSYLQDLHNQYASPNDPNVVQMMRNLLLENDETSAASLPLHPEGFSRLAHGHDIANSAVGNVTEESSKQNRSFLEEPNSNFASTPMVTDATSPKNVYPTSEESSRLSHDFLEEPNSNLVSAPMVTNDSAKSPKNSFPTSEEDTSLVGASSVHVSQKSPLELRSREDSVLNQAVADTRPPLNTNHVEKSVLPNDLRLLDMHHYSRRDDINQDDNDSDSCSSNSSSSSDDSSSSGSSSSTSSSDSSSSSSSPADL